MRQNSHEPEISGCVPGETFVVIMGPTSPSSAGAQHRGLATYRATGRDDDHAWALYRWNLDLAAAFTALSCDVEVTQRNTIHDRLTGRFGRDDWWASTDLVLDDITSETLPTAAREAA